MARNPQSSKEGYIMVDHRACPGLQHPELPVLLETATLCCAHCGRISIRNPKRIRVRGYCTKCDSYICDVCVGIARRPDYVHRSLAELKDLVKSDKVRIVGGTIAEPVLIWL